LPKTKKSAKEELAGEDKGKNPKKLLAVQKIGC
jgi:hypothetical protein